MENTKAKDTLAEMYRQLVKLSCEVDPQGKVTNAAHELKGAMGLILQEEKNEELRKLLSMDDEFP